MASRGAGPGRDDGTGHPRHTSDHDPKQSPDRYRPQERQSYVQAVHSSSQYTGGGYGPSYGYYNHNAPTQSFDQNIPRSPPLPLPYAQGTPGMMYGMVQGSVPQQYGVYSTAGGSSQRHPSMSGPPPQSNYYTSSGYTQQSHELATAQHGGALDQNRYYSQPSTVPSTYTSTSQAMLPPPIPQQGNPSFSPQSNPSEPGSTPSLLSTQLTNYNRIIRRTLEMLKADRLPEAASGLLEMSYELLRNVEQYDLVYDDVNKRTARLKLWRNFNNTWLGVLTKQKDTSDSVLRAMVDSTNTTTPKVELIPTSVLQRLGDELVPLCNAIEEWGLVDYEMGVWEEQIIDILGPCVEVSENIERIRSGRPPRTAKRPSTTARGAESTEAQSGAAQRTTASPLSGPGESSRR